MTQLSNASTTGLVSKSRLIFLCLLIALSDFLIFKETLGLNLFLFAAALTLAVIMLSKRKWSITAKCLLIGVSAFGNLPLLEAVSPMSVSIGLSSVMCVALACAGLMPRRLMHLHVVLLRFALVLPVPFAKAIHRHALSPRDGSFLRLMTQSLVLWLLPLALASVFLLLFAMANPLIEHVIREIDLALVWEFFDLWRVGLWLVVAVLGWAMFRPCLLRRAHLRRFANEKTHEAGKPLLTYALLLRSLLVFNALFAVQSILDVVYLWGGAALPDDLSYAEYAHRGAYPLIVTALLAAAFVLLTMRQDGPGNQSRLLRGLVFAWIAQNILLCLSSLLRLELYVETYSLTEMRVAAAVWMVLIALGLALILLRIIFRYSNEWLVAVNIAALASVLYLCTVADIPAFIARFNVIHCREIDSNGTSLDFDYLASLGPSSIPAIDLFIEKVTSTNPPSEHLGGFAAKAERNLLIKRLNTRSRDWRGWTYRISRLESYLQAAEPIAMPQEKGKSGNGPF
ncbi:DUF4153 domain-containing protein [Oryzifoliimicrobium ureilyticus]|uniref:DUF4153 domain-containing protein n=1 Tax=Oryzifoliimicrobium ureilyticus TaxID=3113724 RepID=UPI0030760A83